MYPGCVLPLLPLTFPPDLRVSSFYSPLSPGSAWMSISSLPVATSPEKSDSFLRSHQLPIILAVFKRASSEAFSALISSSAPTPDLVLS